MEVGEVKEDRSLRSHKVVVAGSQGGGAEVGRILVVVVDVQVGFGMGSRKCWSDIADGVK